MRSVAVFCGSSMGNTPEFEELARALGRELGQRGLQLVFGGGKVGLMGAVADACMDAGGSVLGVIPQQLMDKEVGHLGVTQLRVTGSMHERKAAMEQAADAFIALPGGFGTLDEFFEIVTWAQLGIHQKPCGILDTASGFFSDLLRFMDAEVNAGFVTEAHNRMILRDTDPGQMLDAMVRWQPTIQTKWITRSDT